MGLKDSLLFVLLIGFLFITIIESSPISALNIPILVKSHIPTSHHRCDLKCPETYKPVCAVDAAGVTRDFPDICILNYVYCAQRKVYAYVKEGEC